MYKQCMLMVVITHKQKRLQQTFDSFLYNLRRKMRLQRQEHIKKKFFYIFFVKCGIMTHFC